MTRSIDRELASDLDAARARLYTRLRAADANALTRRPPNGDWRIIEHLQHLTFTEHAHLGGFLPAPRDLTRIGVVD